MFLGEHLVLAPVYGTRMIVLGIPVLFAGLSGDWKSFQSFAIHLNHYLQGQSFKQGQYMLLLLPNLI